MSRRAHPREAACSAIHRSTPTGIALPPGMTEHIISDDDFRLAARPRRSRSCCARRASWAPDKDTFQPRARRVDQDVGRSEIATAPGLEHEAPHGAALRSDATRAGADHGPPLGGIDGGEHHQARVIGKAIRIFEAALVTSRPLYRRHRRTGALTVFSA
jgi:hypothetical protein